MTSPARPGRRWAAWLRPHPGWLAVLGLGAAAWWLADERRWPSWAVAWAALRATEGEGGLCAPHALALTEELVGRDVAQVPVIAAAYERLADCAASAGDTTAARAWMAAYGRWAEGDTALAQRARMAATQRLLDEQDPAAAEDAAFDAVAGAHSAGERIEALRSLEAVLAHRPSGGSAVLWAWQPEDPAGPGGCSRVPGAGPCSLDAAIAAVLAARGSDPTVRWRAVQRALALGLLELPVGGQLRQDTPAELYALGEWTLADRLLTETNPLPSPEARERQLGLALARLRAAAPPDVADTLRQRALRGGR